MMTRSHAVLVGCLLLVGCADDAATPLTEPALEPQLAVLPALDSTSSIGAGAQHACALDTLGEAWCWGSNQLQQLGRAPAHLCDGVPCSWRPLRVIGGHEFTQLSAGSTHTCAVQAVTGEAWCWGAGGDGRLGNRATGNSARPVIVDAGVQFTQVSAGTAHTCGLATNGRIWCWGHGVSGQAGRDYTTALVPRVLPGLRTYRMVSAGADHTCAIDANADAWCWGGGFQGQLGDSLMYGGSTTSPVRVNGPGNWIWISAGPLYSCGIRTNHFAYCWGSNEYGQLGYSGADVAVPHRVPGSALYERIRAGSYHTCALQTSGRATCWGAAGFGEMGNDSLPPTSTPVRPRGGVRYDDIAAGFSFNCGVNEAGRVFCWGRNQRGDVGREPTPESPHCNGAPCEPHPVAARTQVVFE